MVKMIHKLVMVFIIVATIASMVNAQSEWHYPYYTIDGRGNYSVGDSGFLLTGNNVSIPSSGITKGVTTSILIGDLYDGNANEVVWSEPETNSIYVFDWNLTTVYANQSYGSGVILSYSLFDHDNDGKEEIIVVYDNGGGTSTFAILGVTGSGFITEDSIIIGKYAQQNTPICQGQYCYFSDDESNIWRYNTMTDTIGSINVGTNTNTPKTDHPYVPYIMDCSPAISGDELIVIGDYDSDDLYNDIAMIPINDFQIGNVTTYNLAATEIDTNFLGNTVPLEIVDLTCEQINGASYISFNYERAGNSPNACNPGLSTTDYEIRFRYGVREISSNGTLVHNNNVTVISEAATNRREYSFSTFWQDVNNDGRKDVCMPSRGLYDASGNPSCGGGGGDYRYKFNCYDVNTTNLKNYTTNIVNGDGGSQSEILTKGFLGDVDNDGNVEWQAGSKYVDLVSESESTIPAIDSSTHFSVAQSYGDQCLIYYYEPASGNDDYDLEMTYSTENSCSYPSGGESTAANDIPTIDTITYSETGIDLNTQDTININATASDDESDDIYWAYTCDFDGTADPIRTSEEYIPNSTNISAISERFNLGSGNTFSNVYETDTLIGYVLNLTILNSTSGTTLTDFYHNATTSGQSLNASYVTTHWVNGWDLDIGTDEGGLFVAGRDETEALVWGIFVQKNQSGSTENEVFRLNSSGHFVHVQTSNGIEDRVYVDADFDNERYRIRIDNDYDGTIDFTSQYYDFVNTGVGNYDDTYFFTTALGIEEGDTLGSLTITQPDGTAWLDDLFVEYHDLPQFDLDNPSNSQNFQCTYTGVGTYTVRTWVTDDAHPNNYTSFETQNIVVTQSSTPPSIDCTGFVEPTCTGSCYFFDDFNYNYSIACNTWNGGNAKFPFNNQLGVEQTNMDALSLWLQYNDIGNEPIYEEEYLSSTVDFDFTMVSDDRTSLILYDKDLANTATYVYWQNGNIYALQSGASFTKFLFNYDANTTYDMNIVIDLQDKEATYTLDGNFSDSVTVNFYDTDTDNIGYWYLSPVDFNDANMLVDNFLISYGNTNPDFDGDLPTESDYTYTPKYFCALNLSAEVGEQVLEQNCIDRGYNMNYPYSGLCVPRACVADSMSFVFNWATSNLFLTIIVVTAFILLAPLFVSRRR